ncbi:MAG: hypothetical protein M1840_001089 [Geoglossum simile]|nr:MAG: hypothetical protein M1840_001089 [Geoglossum simile]
MSYGFAVGDFVATGQLAWALYRDCYTVARGAPQEFQLLLGEITALSGSLKILQEEVDNPDSILRRSGEDRVRMVNEMVSRVNVTLRELQKVATKYTILGNGSKGKRIWQKLKWSVEFSSIDSLRNKLIYHNGVMNLLLTSVGNSSLNRIESSTRALETDVTEIKGYIRASSRTQGNQSSEPPLVSVAGDEIFRISLSAALMKNAEVLQPWSAIGIEQWIQAGKWWLLKSQMELYATPASGRPVSVAAYTNLIKASWILTDIVTCHPQLMFLNSSTRYEVKLLSAALKHEFQRIGTLGLVIPNLCDLEDQNLQIWEIQPRGPLLRPGKRAGNLGHTQENDTLWTVGGERMYFQR